MNDELLQGSTDANGGEAISNTMEEESSSLDNNNNSNNKVQLTEDETQLLNERLKPILLNDHKLTEEEEEDVTDLIDYTLAMVQNGNSSDFVIKELVAMDMEVCTEEKAIEIGRTVDEFLSKRRNQQNTTTEGTIEPDGTTTTTTDGGAAVTESKPKQNALTMAGALGSGRKSATSSGVSETTSPGRTKQPKNNALIMAGALGAPRKGESRPTSTKDKNKDATEVKNKLLERRNSKKKQKQQKQKHTPGRKEDNKKVEERSFIYDVGEDDVFDENRASTTSTPSRGSNRKNINPSDRGGGSNGGGGGGGRGGGRERQGRPGRNAGDGRTSDRGRSGDGMRQQYNRSENSGRGGGRGGGGGRDGTGALGRGGGRGGRHDQHHYHEQQYNQRKRPTIASEAFDRLSSSANGGEHHGERSGPNKRQRGSFDGPPPSSANYFPGRGEPGRGRGGGRGRGQVQGRGYSAPQTSFSQQQEEHDNNGYYNNYDNNYYEEEEQLQEQEYPSSGGGEEGTYNNNYHPEEVYDEGYYEEEQTYFDGIGGRGGRGGYYSSGRGYGRFGGRFGRGGGRGSEGGRGIQVGRGGRDGGGGRGFYRGGIGDGVYNYNQAQATAGRGGGGGGRGFDSTSAGGGMRKMTYVRGQNDIKTNGTTANNEQGGEEVQEVPPSDVPVVQNNGEENAGDVSAGTFTTTTAPNNHPSPIVQDNTFDGSFGGRGGYGGRFYRGGGRGRGGGVGWGGRGGGRGQYVRSGSYEHVAHKVAQKKWVRQKPEGGEESQQDAS